MNNLEILARKIVALKQFLTNDPNGDNVHDEEWQQELPEAQRVLMADAIGRVISRRIFAKEIEGHIDATSNEIVDAIIKAIGDPLVLRSAPCKATVQSTLAAVKSALGAE